MITDKFIHIGIGDTGEWFPLAFAQWRGCNWIEDIEVCMCQELYTDELRAFVEREDAELLKRHGYEFPE